MDTPVSNIPEYSVADIAGAVKRTLEGAFGRVRIRGELSAVKRYPSGHIYMCLKDEGATLNAIIWKSAAARVGLKPEDGTEVIATGRITAWGDKSQYQLIIERLEYAGAGAMLARIEALRRKLATEGLFGRSRALPMLPAIVGVVTSAQGAVLHDIRTTIARRFGRRILLWPVPVQGEAAAGRIAAAIAGFGTLPRDGLPRPDVLIVARGGGSLEDLMAFNDEAVVRAAAASTIPLISAVGHETDHTLIDLAADHRAPTPTAAAELAVPARLELLAALAQTGSRLTGALARTQQERRIRLSAAGGRLPDVAAMAEGARQRLDDRAHRLDLAVPNLLGARRGALAQAGGRLPDVAALAQAARHRLLDRGHRLDLALPNLLGARRAALGRAERHLPDPRAILAAARQRVAGQATHLQWALPRLTTAATSRLAATRPLPEPQALIAGRAAAVATAGTALATSLRHTTQRRANQAAGTLSRLSSAPVLARLREAAARLQGAAALLEGVNPRAVLARGYALVFDAAGQPVSSAPAARKVAALRIEFADGAVGVTVDRQRALPL